MIVYIHNLSSQEAQELQAIFSYPGIAEALSTNKQTSNSALCILHSDKDPHGLEFGKDFKTVEGR